MVSSRTRALLDALPQSREAAGARQAFKRAALSLMADPDEAGAVVAAIGRLETRGDPDDRLAALISGETAFSELPEQYGAILSDPATLCHRIRYD